MEITKKVCSACKIEKPFEAFQKGTGKFKLRSQCKECCKKLYDTPERMQKMIKKRQERRDTDPAFRAKVNNDIKAAYRKDALPYLLRSAKKRAKDKGWEF